MAIAASEAPADRDERQRIARVLIGIAHAAAVEIKRVIEQRTVAVWRRSHLLQEFREQLDVVRVDPGDLGDVLGIVAVMRDRVVLFGARRSADRSAGSARGRS